MDSIGWILMIIVAICVVALVLIKKKQKQMEEFYDSFSSETDEKESKKAEKKITVAPINEGPMQITIYSYQASKEQRLCALCDGENEKGAVHCRICGQKL